MAEHKGIVKSGQRFDPSPYALDLYRLLCTVLADKEVAELAVKGANGVAKLQAQYRAVEITRILVSSAVALRIVFDQYPGAFGELPQRACGTLYPNWPDPVCEELTLREAFNKIIHATEINDDLVIPDEHRNPDEEGSYVRPFMYLYGTKDKTRWRAELSIVEFVRGAASAFLLRSPA
jgi:hypothetical protein